MSALCTTLTPLHLYAEMIFEAPKARGGAARG